MLELSLDEINVFNRMDINVRERRLSFPTKLCGIMETVWTEPTSSSPCRTSATKISPKEEVQKPPRDMLELSLDEINVFNRMEINVKERRLSFPTKLCDIMETVWTEPTSSEPCRPCVTKSSTKEEVQQSPRDYFANLCDTDCQDELFLLPESVLNMDSEAVREDLSRIAMSFGRPSPHNSLDSTDSGKSLRLLEDPDGFHLARASDDCRTLWICEMSGMTGVRAPSASMTQSMMATPSPSLVNDKATPDLMTTSMNSLSGTPNKSSKRPLSHRSRTDVSAAAKEREDRVRRLREQQEDERKKKLEELKQHALSSQKFREQQEVERRRHIEDLRSKDQERRNQVEERRKEIEKAENERRDALFQRNKEREDRINTQRKNSRSHIDFAFGSSAPRLLEPRIDSGYWGSRSSADRNSAERETDLRNKRTVSAQGLDRSTEGEEDGLVGGFSSGAHRRRTDLVPTIVMPRGGGGEAGRSGTPSKMTRSPGISRENTASRPGSAMSGTSAPPRSGGAVRLRSAPSRRPRPTSIATTGMTAGMTASMYEERQKPIHVPRQKLLSTPKADRMKRARSVTSDTGVDDDAKSTTSSVGGSRTPARKTPAQVKAEAAARKAKATRQTPSTPKTSTGKREVDKKSPSPALSSENVARSDGDGENQRQITPDIIKDNNKEKESDEKENSPEVENDNSNENRERNIISSEEEAKARIAQKRKEMKEKKEREEELERQRQAELERLEEERRLREEEEERKMMIEADRLAAEARIAEEERVQKAIEEAELERKRQEEEEEKLKKEKEEVEKKAKEEAEKREIELQEKLKKEEEERLARKKRIEEIMARTRGKNSTPNTTPKKEVEPEEHQSPSQPASLNIDPTKPDLLGDINDSVSVAAENAKNIEVSASSSVSENGVAEESKDVVKNGDAEVEKGTIDSMSKADLIVNSNAVTNNVDMENSKSPSPSPLIDVEEPPKKPGNAVSEGGAEFDQLIDLGQLQDTNKTDQPEHSPIIAFEDSITSPRQQQNAAELLS